MPNPTEDSPGSVERPYIGGQAVIEGVMMRAPGGVAVAVRRPDGSLVVRDGPLPRSLRAPVWKVPGLRGIATLVESLSLGYSALQFSAEQQEEAERSRGAGAATGLLPMLLVPVLLARGPEERSGGEDDDDRGAAPERSTEGGSGGSRLALVISTLLALALFIALPQALATATGWLLGVQLDLGDWRFHVLTGLFKLIVLTGYLVAIAQIPEIRRVFQYHGAEHKTIHAYEAALPLEVEHVRRQSTLHPRCGTTFLILVVIVSVVLGSIVTPILLPDASGVSGQLATLALRISLLPLIASVSYEIQRCFARYCTRGMLRALLWPGFLFQKITTREPDDRQIEVAIAAMQSAFWRERQAGRAPACVQVRRFPSLDGALAYYA